MQLQGEDKEVVEALRQGDLDNAPVDDAHRELLRFVGLVTQHAYRTSPETIDRLRGHGWSDEQIGEAVYVAGLFALFNRVADAFGLEDPGYFEMEQRGEATPIPAERFEQD